MTFVLQEISNGKDMILYNDNKYRESYSLKNGDIVWRCLGRVCKATVRTDKKKTAIYFSNDTHTGSHPVTMRVLTPTPPSRDSGRVFSTPEAGADAPVAEPVSRGIVSTASSATSACATTPATPLAPSAVTSVPLVLSASSTCASTPVAPLALSAATSTLLSPTLSSKPSSANIADILAENEALKREVLELRTQRKDLLDHSIESDMRLLQYTNDVFATGTIPSRLVQHQAVQTDLTTDDGHGIPSEQCNKCKILTEESINMIAAIRSLEEQIRVLQLTSSTNKTDINQISTSSNRYDVLSEGSSETNEDGFFCVVRKNKNRKKTIRKNATREDPLNHIEAFKSNKEEPHLQTKKTKQRHTRVDSLPFATKYKEWKWSAPRKTPFLNVTVVGDSHARRLAPLINERTTEQTTVTGICKPGAGLLDVAPTGSSPLSSHCYVLMAGTNDVDRGREEVIFNHLEEVIGRCCGISPVLLMPLFPRYDLEPDNPIHESVARVNSFMTDLCGRYEDVQMFDNSDISRGHHTTHGLHLRARGKRRLADLIVERLARMTPPATHHPRRSATETPGRGATSPTPGPITLPYQSYAEAVSCASPSASVQHQPVAAPASKNFHNLEIHLGT